MSKWINTNILQISSSNEWVSMWVYVGDIGCNLVVILVISSEVKETG